MLRFSKIISFAFNWRWFEVIQVNKPSLLVFWYVSSLGGKGAELWQAFRELCITGTTDEYEHLLCVWQKISSLLWMVEIQQRLWSWTVRTWFWLLRITLKVMLRTRKKWKDVCSGGLAVVVMTRISRNHDLSGFGDGEMRWAVFKRSFWDRNY